MAEEMYTHTKKKLVNLHTTSSSCHVEAEIVLPEYKAEAERIVRATPKAVVRNKTVTVRDRKLICEIEGSIGFHILYQIAGGEGKTVSSFLQAESFSQSFQIPCEIEELSPEEVLLFAEALPRASLVKLSGPRKLTAKCEVEVSLEVKCNGALAIFSAEASEELITDGEELRFTRLHQKYTEEMNFSQTIALPKAYLPIEEVCEMNAVLFAKGVKSEDGGVSFLGVCDLHCSYTAAEENLFISFYQPIEFEKRVGIPEISSGMPCCVFLTPTALKAAADVNEEGENKNILFELDYLCEVNAFETESAVFACDAFSTDHAVSLAKKQEQLQELLGIFDFSDSVKAAIPAPDPSVIRTEGVRAGVEFSNSYLESGKLCLEGRIGFSYLGIFESGEMKHYEGTHDFKTVITPPVSIPEGEECSVEVCGGAAGVDVEPGSQDYTLRFELCGSIFVYKLQRPEVISSLEIGEAFERKRGEILFVYPREGEDLWSLAKEYHVSPDQIREQNHLIGESLPLYLKLIR